MKYIFGFFMTIGIGGVCLIIIALIVEIEHRPRSEDYKYTVWVGHGGNYTNEYQVEDGFLIYKDTDQKTVRVPLTSLTKIEEN